MSRVSIMMVQCPRTYRSVSDSWHSGKHKQVINNSKQCDNRMRVISCLAPYASMRLECVKDDAKHCINV